jgi:hypothetical protein
VWFVHVEPGCGLRLTHSHHRPHHLIPRFAQFSVDEKQKPQLGMYGTPTYGYPLSRYSTTSATARFSQRVSELLEDDPNRSHGTVLSTVTKELTRRSIHPFFNQTLAARRDVGRASGPTGPWTPPGHKRKQTKKKRRTHLLRKPFFLCLEFATLFLWLSEPLRSSYQPSGPPSRLDLGW